MTKQQILPTILIVINCLTSLVYFVNGDVKKAIYWIAAGILTITVTF